MPSWNCALRFAGICRDSNGRFYPSRKMDLGKYHGDPRLELNRHLGRNDDSRGSLRHA